MDVCDTRSSSTIMLSPPCALMACSSAAALAALRVVRTTRKPSLANFWAMAPPTPQRTPTGRWLSSTALPCASFVLRPSACHLEVAPTTTATCLPAALIGVSSLLVEGWRRSYSARTPRVTLTDTRAAMPQLGDNVQIVLSESNFACIDGATAKGSPVRKAVDTASQQGRSGDRGAGGTVMISCNEAQAE